MNKNDDKPDAMNNTHKSFLTDKLNCIYHNNEQREKVVDAYLEERLKEKERKAFEHHFFICDICFQEVQLREELAA